MAQSNTLREFFSQDGELDQAFRDVFPLSLGLHSLEFSKFTIEEAGSDDDILAAVFRVVIYADTSLTSISDILEQNVQLLFLPRAVEDEVYRIQTERLWIRAPVVRERLLRFVRGLAREATALHAKLDASAKPWPASFFARLR